MKVAADCRTAKELVKKRRRMLRISNVRYGFYHRAKSNPSICMTKSNEPVEKVIFRRLIKNARMQGARNPEE
jgi:hypothetical protein